MEGQSGSEMILTFTPEQAFVVRVLKTEAKEYTEFSCLPMGQDIEK